MQRCVSTSKRGPGEVPCSTFSTVRPDGPAPRLLPAYRRHGLGLALIVGSNNYLKADIPLPEIPTTFLYFGCWFLTAGLVYYFFGMETKGKSIAEIDRELAPA